MEKEQQVLGKLLELFGTLNCVGEDAARTAFANGDDGVVVRRDLFLYLVRWFGFF